MTNRELLMMLDGDLGERAIKNCIDYHGGENYLTKFGKDISGALGGAFAWYDTDEGYEFWKRLYFELIALDL